jgi:hypothetical protein
MQSVFVVVGALRSSLTIVASKRTGMVIDIVSPILPMDPRTATAKAFIRNSRSGRLFCVQIHGMTNKLVYVAAR